LHRRCRGSFDGGKRRVDDRNEITIVSLCPGLQRGGKTVPNPVAPVVDLTEDERSQLFAWSRRSTSPNGLATRSRIVLAAAEGISSTAIAD
jgi:hypothetical protein